MTAPPPRDVQGLTRAGVEALREGDPRRARELLLQATATGRADGGAWLALAYAAHGLGDSTGKLEAVDRALELEPRNFRALLLKADHFNESGDQRAASAFYKAALKAAPAPDRMTPLLRSELERARGMAERTAGALEAYLRDTLAAQGHGGPAQRRFEHSLDLMFGRKRIYQQQPSVFYFPELPQKQFYDRAELPWLEALEAETDAIRNELLAVLGGPDAFRPYLEADPTRPMNLQHGMIGNPDWSAFFLKKNGEVQAENAARCPRTAAAVAATPVTDTKPSSLFSLLRARAHIPAHTGFLNTRLICHLPLIVPPDCRLRVGNDVRRWEAGRAWVFDDTMEHEAWNDSDQTRVILLFDVWRPELTPEERVMVQGLMSAIEAYEGEARDLSL